MLCEGEIEYRRNTKYGNEKESRKQPKIVDVSYTNK